MTSSPEFNSNEALHQAARWCEEYFRAHPDMSVGHSMVSLLDLFSQMASVQSEPAEDQRLLLSSLNERVEAYVERFARGDLSGIPLANVPEPSDSVKVELQGHVAFEGDTDWVPQPQACSGEQDGRAIQGFSLRLAEDGLPVSLRYKAHLAFKGDTDWHEAGDFCGTRGEWRRMEAFWIDLDDQSEQFDVFYSAHLARLGWTGWFKNGQMCGTRGEYRQVEGIKVFVAERNGEAV
ncbi:MAG: hypothetical protein CMJ78_02000 [Planctomycetaceae bacterium]|nr:hypothetical protein [Planctomycetaceae bacterium]